MLAIRSYVLQGLGEYVLQIGKGHMQVVGDVEPNELQKHRFEIGRWVDFLGCLENVVH